MIRVDKPIARCAALD